MSEDVSLPSVPNNATGVYEALDRALGDVELTEEERDAVGSYVAREVPALLDTRVTGYLILGSYRDGFHQRLRAVQHEIGNRRTDASAVVLGDTAELSVDETDLPAFTIKFNLLASAADLIAMVMEKESGGEGPELGRIVDGPYFEYSHVLPRDYVGFNTEEIHSLDEAKRAALEIWFNDHMDETEKVENIDRLCENCGYVNKPDAVWDFVEEREEGPGDPATYSWVHLSDFRKFERVDRCHPWTSEAQLRHQATSLPGPGQAGWPARES